MVYACQTTSSDQNEPTVAIDSTQIEKHIERLASDEFLGRKPFTEGEEKTVAYLQNELTNMGLEPGNGESYFQEVPLVEIDAIPDSTMVVRHDNEQSTLRYRKDYVALTRRITDQIDIEQSELVFCGFGIVAPEYGWNDYEGVDMAGKTAVVLVNDPGFGSSDSSLFKGNTMTYYGRWTYKYEEAARTGSGRGAHRAQHCPGGLPLGSGAK